MLQPGDFNWNEQMQGFVLAAFFYGYVTTQIPGGVMAQRFGGKRLLLFGIFWTAVLTILTPLFTRLGDFPAIMVTRILEGIGEVRRWLTHVICGVAYQRSYSTVGPVSTWMGDCLRAGKPSRYEASQLGHSAFYPLWDGKLSVSFRAE